MLFHLLFISFAFVSTDSMDNLGGDEFDEDGGVGGAPKAAVGGPDSISGPQQAEGGPTSSPTEVEGPTSGPAEAEGPTSGPKEAEGGPNFGPTEAKEGSNPDSKEAEIGTRAGITFSEIIFTLSLFKFADFVQMTSVSVGITFSEIVFTFSVFEFADFIELTLPSGGITFSEIVFTLSVFEFADLVELTSVSVSASTMTSGDTSSDLTFDIWIFLAFIECKLPCSLRLFVVG